MAEGTSGLPLGFGQAKDTQADAPVYTISQLNREVRGLLESAYPMVWLEGEISNFTHHRSGHMYLTLKDENAQVDAAMFRMANQSLTFTPENGMSVLALAQVTVYEPRGRYQVVLQDMKPAGVGKLQLTFEQLKAKLHEEGLFDPERKKTLPSFPNRIGIVTASGAAALRDMHNILSRRFPAVEVLLFPAKVQGEGSGEEVAASIEQANRYSQSEAPVDVLIVGRGGGSLEDLWAFNEEVVARAIAASNIPVVSAVGHEVDVTISDFVADMRAPTPSAAAELVVPDQEDVLYTVRTRTQQVARLCIDRWKEAGNRLEWIQRSHGLRRPAQRLRDVSQTLDQLQGKLKKNFETQFKQRQQSFETLLGRLNQSNPTTILGRGYAALKTEAGDSIKSSEQVTVGDVLKLQLSDGEVKAEVKEVNHE